MIEEYEYKGHKIVINENIINDVDEATKEIVSTIVEQIGKIFDIDATVEDNPLNEVKAYSVDDCKKAAEEYVDNNQPA